jgi:hypothetical protein
MIFAMLGSRGRIGAQLESLNGYGQGCGMRERKGKRLGRPRSVVTDSQVNTLLAQGCSMVAIASNSASRRLQCAVERERLNLQPRASLFLIRLAAKNNAKNKTARIHNAGEEMPATKTPSPVALCPLISPNTGQKKSLHRQGVTPAMESGLSDHVWTIEELCGLLPQPVMRKRISFSRR